MKQPQISVIVPVYNAERTIDRCIGSILNSTLEDIEVNEKSELRILIEKFVDENPEAVALLLRNWLDEDWG